MSHIHFATISCDITFGTISCDISSLLLILIMTPFTLDCLSSYFSERKLIQSLSHMEHSLCCVCVCACACECGNKCTYGCTITHITENKED